MNYEHSAITKGLLDKMYEIGSLNADKRHQEALPIIEEVLQSEDLAKVEKETGARDRFLYLKAVALDLTGKSEEALEILINLVREHPGGPDYEKSLQVVCGGFEKKARDLIEKKPEDPLLKSFLHVLDQYGWSPYWLIEAVARQEATEGKTEVAWLRMQALLALSPNDHDYLRSALSIACEFKLTAKKHELCSHIQDLLERYPYRIELAELLLSHGGAQCSVSSGT